MSQLDAPKINYLTMIDPHRIEIYWNQNVHHASIQSNYSIWNKNQPLSLLTVRKDHDDDWNTRPTYEPFRKRVTLYLQEPVDQSALNQLTVRINGTITNDYSERADTNVTYIVNDWHDYYTFFTRASSGILIKSNDKVSSKAHAIAKDIIDIQLSKLSEVTSALIKSHADLAIYSTDEYAYDIPEHRGGALVLDRPVEGFGGCIGNPTTSISEQNILRLTSGIHQTKYINECILVHEFGHAIHLLGINHLTDATLSLHFKKCYQHAKSENLWPNTYLIQNYEEYFATLSTIWFNVMAESKTGTWDGTRGPINTRSELQTYDSMAYDFFASIYPKISLSYPWDKSPVFFPNNESRLEITKL